MTVVLASAGYPQEPKVGIEITGIKEISGARIFHAGTKSDSDRLVSSGGRVFAVTGIGSDLESARARSYEAISNISLAGSHYRKDIALTASMNEKGA